MATTHRSDLVEHFEMSTTSELRDIPSLFDADDAALGLVERSRWRIEHGALVAEKEGGNDGPF